MQIFHSIGAFGYLIWQVLGSLVFIVRDRRRVLEQLELIGVNAIPLVLVTGVFSGTIIAWQAAYQFRGIVSLGVLGGQVAKTIMMEMAPVLTGLVMSGRVGASMTAEIGSMKVSEQIDALRVMSIDPIRYIVMPRLVSLFLMMPILTLFATITAIFGAYAVSAYFLDISPYTFSYSVKNHFEIRDLMGGIIKSAFFGILIALIGCFKGLNTSGGTKGVGSATISSFVLASIAVLASDFLLWIVLF
jgi:phospholipid/cholesterol/gamma-HCH transport system permease protein